MNKIQVNCQQINVYQHLYFIFKVTSIDSTSKISKIQGFVL